jgi:hypothetical protein
MKLSLKAVLNTVVVCMASTSAMAQPVFEEDGPFRSGEGFGTAATCETIGEWIDRVPDYDGRITMVIKGSIKESQWDGALAYLVMCKPDGIQVMCVTYAQREASSEIVLFAGGYSRVGERQIMLDPCLIYPVE